MALLVASDFNARKRKSVLPHFYQHVTCATRGEKTQVPLYSTHRNAYKTLPHPPFGKSDHDYPTDSCLQAKTQTGSTSDALNTEVV